MKILVANLGSTSLKYRLFDCSGKEEKLLTRGGFERVTDYAAAIDSCLSELKNGGFITSEKDLAAVGFKPIIARDITGCVRMDERVLQAMEAYREVAPAHNPPYINGVRIFSKKMPSTPMIGLFETSFYQWAPKAAVRYAVPKSWYDEGVRRWGFHGASHKFIAERSAELLGRSDVAERVRMLYVNNGATPIRKPDLRVVSCHLGGSSSLTAILNGVGMCNSMGMTPQAGLPQNNRVGELDAFAIPLMMRRQKLTVEQVEYALSKEGGLKALSGGFNDMRDIRKEAENGNEDAKLAIDVLVWQARHWLGAYFLQMNGLDGFVFTAGIAENNPWLRSRICADLDQLGIKLDEEKNASAPSGQEVEISAADSKVKIFVVPTNEELVIAREVKRFLENH
ncbi:MAG: acetate kinase [Verrucomicrobia bacterium]|nr:acetate kinase [Verrucomicrobiota bacterium]MBO7108409.1 acetate kinase [Verrucomicrobiota bacterium]MBO7524883.1 acetate kinase [Verrucomicrobiota bacterium]